MPAISIQRRLLFTILPMGALMLLAMVLLAWSIFPAESASTQALHDVIINEWSQGNGGNKEWVELLVVNGPVDLRGWDLGDSSPGDLSFSNDDAWNGLPAGTVIVIYNATDPDTILPPNDFDSSDFTLVLPHNDAALFTGGGFPAFANGTSTDNPVVRDSSDAVVHDYNTEPGSGVHPESNENSAYLSNSADGVALDTNWSIGSAATATPGVGNDSVNSAWINLLRIQQKTLNRPQDAVVISAANLPANLVGLSDTGLRFFSYDADANTFYAVPYQVDNITSSGTYTTSLGDDDGASIIDATDQLVFMADDTLDQYPGIDFGGELFYVYPNTIMACPLPVGSPVYEVEITDPLDGGVGYTYIITDTTCSASTADYILWDEDNQEATGDYTTIVGDDRGAFVAGFGGAPLIPPGEQYLGIDSLHLNGSPIDVLDRMKIRLDACSILPGPLGCPALLRLELNEITAALLLGLTTIDVPIDGPVRLASGGVDSEFSVFAYGSRLDINVAVDPLTLVPPLQPWVYLLRASFDLNDPAEGSGLTNWFDSNGNAYTVDGTPDATPASFNWYQVVDDGTIGGMVVTLPTLDPGDGTAAAYYWDDTANPPPDGFLETGDGVSYGDTGVQIIDSESSAIAFDLAAYILPAGTSSNVGDQYFNWVNNPLGDAVSVNAYTIREGSLTAVQVSQIKATAGSPAWGMALLAGLTLISGVMAVGRARRRRA